MKILVLTDIHDNIHHLEHLRKDLIRADLVLVAGDITNFGTDYQAKRVIDAILKYNKHIFAVSGNCDLPGVESYLNKVGINLSGQWRQIDDYFFWGLGGSLPAPGRTPNELSEQQFGQTLSRLADQIKQPEKLILLVHQPPLNTVADCLYDNRHVGSKALRRFVEELQPLAYFTGHSHEGQGIDAIGRTTIVNPGPFRSGHYALASLTGNQIEVEIKSL